MASGTARLSGSQVFALYEEVVKYAKENGQLMMVNVAVNVNLQSGAIVLTDYGWEERETFGKHTDDTPSPYTVSKFRASITF